MERALSAELGAGPLARARAQRAQTARVLLETTPEASAIVYFFHDLGQAAHPHDRARGSFKMSAIIDSLEFTTEAQANRALQRNSFMLLAKNRGPWNGMQPRRPFFDNRHPEFGIYSKEGYWDSSEVQDWRRA